MFPSASNRLNGVSGVVSQISRRTSASISSAFRDLANPPSQTIAGLDALRSLAILLVFSDHYFFNYSRITQSHLSLGAFPLFTFGWTGVDLFFVLSGYLIGAALLSELKRSSTIDMPRFLLRRGLRIWPYYFFFILAMWLLINPTPISNYFPDLFFYSNYIEGYVPGGWSLSTEEQFYIAIPIVLLLSVRFLNISRQWTILALAVVLLPLARAITVAKLGPHSHEGMPRFIIYTPFHTHADGLVAGLIIAWFSVVYPASVAGKSFLENCKVPLLLVAAGILLRHASQDLFAFTALAAIYGGCALFAIRDRSILSKLFSSRLFYWISRLSYAIYLNHLIVLYKVCPAMLRAANPEHFVYLKFALCYVALFAMSMAIALVTFVLVESPFLQLRERLLAKRSSR